MSLLKIVPLGVVVASLAFAADKPVFDQKAYCENVISVTTKSYLRILETQKRNNDLRVFDDKLRTEIADEVTPIALEALKAVKATDGDRKKANLKKEIAAEFDEFSFAEAWHRLYHGTKTKCPEDFKNFMLTRCVRCPYDESFKRKLFLSRDGAECLLNPGDKAGAYHSEEAEPIKRLAFGGGWDPRSESYYFSVCSSRSAEEARRGIDLEVCYQASLKDILSGKASKEADLVRAEVLQKFPDRKLESVKIVPKLEYLKKRVVKNCWKYIPELATDPVKVASEGIDPKTAPVAPTTEKTVKPATDQADRAR